MANYRKIDSDRPANAQFADNPADVNNTPDLTALEPIPKRKIGRPNKERKTKQLLDRIATKKKDTIKRLGSVIPVAFFLIVSFVPFVVKCSECGKEFRVRSMRYWNEILIPHRDNHSS